MSTFDLENFVSPLVNDAPSWVAEGNSLTKALYSKVVEEVKELECLIDQGDELSLRERTVIASRIALSLNIDKSNIRSSRRPELIDFIERENEKLINRYEALKLKARRGRHKTKSETETENLVLQRQLHEMENLKMKEFLEAAIERDLLSTQRNLKEKNEALESELSACRRRNAGLSESNRELIKELAQLAEERDQLRRLVAQTKGGS